MSDHIRVSKLEAAQRQLNCAIRMLFAGGDPIAAHTLAGAAALLFSDLVNAKCPEKSWDKMAREAVGLPKAEYQKIMRHAQNFLKHAENDPDGMLNLDPKDTDALVFCALMNASELSSPLTYEAQVFQLWYVASQPPDVRTAEIPDVDVNRWFGEMHSKSRKERIQIGQQALTNWEGI